MTPEILSKANVLWYVGALICFFLPFFELSCENRANGGERHAFAHSSGVEVIRDSFTFNNSELATMMKANSTKSSDKSLYSTSARVLTALAALALAGGVVLILVESPPYAKTVACVAGFVAAACLISMAISETGPMADASVMSDDKTVVSLKYGWWLAMLLSLVGGVMTFRMRQPGSGEGIARWIGALSQP